jgi:hypothetical protein
MTYQPDAADEPVHPDVRSMLWRLRARLVSPPDEQRVADDLDRILAAAREHAHGDDVPVPAPVEDTPTRLTPVGVLRPTPKPDAHSRIYALSRVAAAAVLVVAVGGGIATARDGVVIDALLGRTAPSGSAAQLALPIDPDGLGDAAPNGELPEPTPVPLVDPDEADGGDTTAPADDADDVSPADRPTDDADGDDRDGRDRDAGDGGEVADDPDDAGQPADGPADTESAPRPRAPAPVDDAVEAEDVVDDAPSEEIIAAPPARDVDGFAGPAPCREGQSLADCLAEREAAEDDVVEAEDPGDDDAVDDGAADDDGTEESEQEKLARRRGGG